MKDIKSFLTKIRIESRRSLIKEQEDKITDLMREQLELAMSHKDVEQGKYTWLQKFFGAARVRMNNNQKLKEINDKFNKQTRILFNSVGSTCWIAYLSIRAHDRQKIIGKKKQS